MDVAITWAKDQSIFINTYKFVNVKVWLGKSTILKSQGKRIIMVESKKGTKFIKDVFLVLNLKENLLSIDNMMENGYSFHFEKDTCKVYDIKKV